MQPLKRIIRFVCLTLALISIVFPPVATAAAEQARRPVLHIMAWGETLEQAAARYGVTPSAIREANALSESDLITAGRELVIPEGDEPGGTEHIVQPGDTLSKLSRQYGISVQSIVSANGIVNPSHIYVGQHLIIPGSEISALGVGGPGAIYYVVQRGDTLAAISRTYGVSFWAVVQANNLSNPSLLYTGQTLVIPGVAASAQPADQAQRAPAPEPAARTGGGVHVVQAGETLFRIGMRYNLTVTALMQANGLSSDRIYAGQHLTIPGAGSVHSLDPASSVAPAPAVAAPQAPSASGKLILVVLSEQRVYAYQDGTLLNSFLASTGLPATPTVTGNYSIYLKYSSQRMTGPGYDLPGVPWVMYFYKGYGLHGTYWHSNFGQPMSHGCVNLGTESAKWLYDWAPIGTPVRVQW